MIDSVASRKRQRASSPCVPAGGDSHSNCGVGRSIMGNKLGLLVIRLLFPLCAEFGSDTTLNLTDPDRSYKTGCVSFASA